MSSSRSSDSIADKFTSALDSLKLFFASKSFVSSGSSSRSSRLSSGYGSLDASWELEESYVKVSKLSGKLILLSSASPVLKVGSWCVVTIIFEGKSLIRSIWYFSDFLGNFFEILFYDLDGILLSNLSLAYLAAGLGLRHHGIRFKPYILKLTVSPWRPILEGLVDVQCRPSLLG